MNITPPIITEQAQEALLKSTMKLLPFSFVVALLLGLQLNYKSVPFEVIAAWWCFMMSVVIIRLIHCKGAISGQNACLSSQKHLIIFLFLTVVMGVTWSSAWFIFQPYVNNLDEFVILFSIGSIAIGGLASLSSFYPAFCLYIISMLLPISIYFFSLPTFENLIWFVIVSLYMILLLYVGRVNANTLSRNARLTKEKDRLIDALKNSNDSLVQSLKEIENLSITDSLTGIYNRRYFDKVLKTELDKVRRGDYQNNLIILDVDNFKLINDQFGHPCGDQYIKHLASLLISHFQRANDLVFRIGGDEFAVLLINMNREAAIKHCDAFQKMFNEQNQYPQTSLSIGIIAFDKTFEKNHQDLITEVDQALYMSKRQGKDQMIFKCPSTLSHSQARTKKLL